MTDQDQQRSSHHLKLSALCHAYEHLFAYLDDFDDAISFHQHWDVYRLVSECINEAAKEFGASPAETENVSTLCQDLIERLGASLRLKLTRDSPVFTVFEKYKESVIGSSLSDEPNVTQHLAMGERLSKECYCQYCKPDIPNLLRPAELVLTPRNSQRFWTEPDKSGGVSRVCFEFALHKLTFDTFVNLPFYFFHEFFSHVHSAEMSSEHSQVYTPFADGWLLYAAYEFYLQKTDLPFADYRRYYAKKYWHDAISLDGNNWVRFGSQQAEALEFLAGSNRFWQMTLKLALLPYNHLPAHPDLHHEFLIRMKGWLRHQKKLSPEEREENLEWLDLAVQTDEPIQTLFELLGFP